MFQDIAFYGHVALDTALQMLLTLTPNREAAVLDLCGGTGLFGEKVKQYDGKWMCLFKVKDLLKK